MSTSLTVRAAPWLVRTESARRRSPAARSSTFSVWVNVEAGMTSSSGRRPSSKIHVRPVVCRRKVRRPRDGRAAAEPGQRLGDEARRARARLRAGGRREARERGQAPECDDDGEPEALHVPFSLLRRSALLDHGGPDPSARVVRSLSAG